MGDGDRTTARDLFGEHACHTPVAPEHVAEPHRHEPGRARIADEADDAFADPLRDSHDAGRIDRFVAGDEDEFSDAVASRRFGDDPRSPHVVLDRFRGTCFHQRHMLVGRRMKHQLGPALTKQAVDPPLVGNVGDHGLIANRRMVRIEIDAPVEETVLVAVQQHEQRRLELRDLAAELPSDRAAGAGDQHAAAFDEAPHRFRIQADRLARHQILEREVADLAQLDAAADDVAQVRQRLDRNLERLERFDDAAHLGRLGTRDGNQYLVRPLVPDNPFEVCSRAQYTNAMNGAPDLRRVIVDEADRIAFVKPVVLHVAHDHLAGIAGPDDQHSLIGLEPIEIVTEAPGQPHAGQKADQQDRIDHVDRARIGTDFEDRCNDERKNTRTEHDRGENVFKVPQAGIPPQPLIQPKQPEGRAAQDQQDRQSLQHRQHVRRRRHAVEAKEECRIVGKRRQGEMETNDDRAAVAGEPDLLQRDSPVNGFTVHGPATAGWPPAAYQNCPGGLPPPRLCWHNGA